MFDYEFLTIYYKNRSDLDKTISFFKKSKFSRLNVICNDLLFIDNLTNNIRIINNSINVGFAKAINKGLRIIYSENKYKFLIILNLDVLFNLDDIEKELQILSNEYLYNPLINLENLLYTRLYFNKYKTIYTQNVLKNKLEYPNLSFFIVGSNAIKFYLDERYFMYFEDVQLGVFFKDNNINLKIANKIEIFRKKNNINSELNRINLSIKSAKIYFNKKDILYYRIYLFIMKLRKIKYALFSYLRH